MGWFTSLCTWVDRRVPGLQGQWKYHMSEYYAPKNFNFWYFFGVLSLVILVIQLGTGVWLLMSFEGSSERAFASVEYIMRDVEMGWIIRYMHSTGASAFFLVVYMHMFRGLLYGSYRAPRELVWIFGMTIYVALMAEAFLGYVLPWGQMSFWGAQVIISLFGAIPVVGEAIVEWIRGDYLISGITLNRFMSLHVVAVPIVLLALVVLHILALHEVGSNNPDGVEIKATKDEKGKPLDGIPFYPYYLPVHDMTAIVVFLFAFCGVVFFFPEMGGYFLEHANFEEANPLKTPEHIAPVWYFTPFYSMLRAVTFPIGGITAKLGGFMAMGGAIAVLFVLPWLDRSKAISVRYRGNLTKAMMILFAACFIILGILGVKAVTEARTLLAQVAVVFYFGFFLTMPVWTNKDACSKRMQYILCGIYALAFFLLTVLNVTSGDFYGQVVDGVRVTHPSYLVGAISLALAAFFALLPRLTERNVTKEPPARITMDGGQGYKAFFLGLIVVGFLVFIPVKAVGAETGFHCGTIDCEHIQIDPTDKVSLQNGAKWYMNYCYGCHSTQYARYGRVAEDLEIPEEIMLSTLVLGDQKIGDLIEGSMREEDAKAWFGSAPPDLTLVTRVRSPEWVYTYLKNFYQDDSRPMGVNNKVFPDVGMPHALLEVQGLQSCAPGPVEAHNGGVKQDPLTGEHLLEDPCGTYELAYEGMLTPEEFDQVAHDLTNYLAYMAEPMAQQRRELGTNVLLFLALLFVLVWLLNREYWKEIH
jgi:ubiquinol-cytochrome c reductase cytochrome b subunit